MEIGKHVSTLVKDVADGVLELIYPPKCLICGELGCPWICDACRAKIDPVPQPYCPTCGHPMFDVFCNSCHGRRRSFTAARAAGEYSGVLKEAVHHFKFNGHRMLAPILADLFYAYLIHSTDFPWRSADVIIPIPIRNARKRERGYNQSELLAEELSRLINKPLARNAVKRIGSSHPQVNLSREERLKNVKGAFQVVFPSELVKKKVLLIDDVATTCSTVHECSRTLLDAGASKVYVLCLAFDS